MKKGSITVYLSLMLCVIISLIFVSIDSARYSCGRAMASLSAEEGLFSLFGEYDRLLYDDYGLLVIDGGYGSASLNAGALMNEMKSVINKVLTPETLLGLSSSNLYRADIDSTAFTGLVLATDSKGQMLKDQIIELMKLRAGEDLLESLYETVSGAETTLSEAENSGMDPDTIDDLKNAYEEQKALALEEAEKKKQESGSSDSAETAQLPSDFVNPIDNITALKNLGIMYTAVPDPSKISTEYIDISSLASKRTFAEGIGEMPDYESQATDTFLLAQYIIDYFPNFLSDHDGSGIKYQAEYAIAGKNNDSANLKSVLMRLLLMREALNYLYLMAEPSMKAQVEAAALAICSALMVPSATEAAAQVLMLCWAYAESMMDIKALLSGEKVPLFKSESSWKTGISNLAALSADTKAEGNDIGLTYENYLCALLMMEGGDALMSDIIDLLEYNRRIAGNEPEFSIDTCICAMEIQLEGCIDRHKFTLTRSYGYDICS